MSSPRYDIFFKGECLHADLDVDLLQRRFAKAFKLEPSKAAPYFSGKAIALKKDQTRTDTLKFKKALEGLGAKVYIRNAGIGFDAKPITPTTSTIPVKAKNIEAQASKEYSVLPVGSDLLDTTERAEFVELNIDISHIELSDKDSLEDLIEETNESISFATDHLSTAEVGADILEGFNKVEDQVVQTDTSHISIDDAGGSLLKPEERQVTKATPPNTDHIEVVETDNGLIDAKKPEAVQAPDVSHISLLD